MTHRVYVAGTEPHCGRSLVALGMVELLAARSGRVGYFRPVVAAAPDPQTELVRARYGGAGAAAVRHGATADEARATLSAGGVEALEKQVLAAFRAAEAEHDAIVVEGLDFEPGLDAELDAAIANALGCPVLGVVGCRDAEDPAAAVGLGRQAFERRGCDMLGLVASRVPAERAEATRAALASAGGAPVPVIEEQPELAFPTVAEVATALGADAVGGGDGLDRDVRAARVAAMGAESFLETLAEGTLAIVPGDRADILTAGLAAAGSQHVGALAGMLITGPADPPAAVGKLLADASFPVLRTAADTDAAAAAVAAVRPRLGPDTERRVASALGLFAASVDQAELGARMALARPARLTPAMFEYELIERAKEEPRHIVLPEGDDDRVLEAADILLRRGVAWLTILGNEDAVRGRAATLGLDLSRAQLADPATSPLRGDYAGRLYELRKERGMTEEVAHETAGDANWFGTFMVQTGAADGMVSGAAHTTADTIRPAFQLVKARPGVSVVSSVFLMCMPDQVLVFGDCAVNPKPDPDQLADIAIGSAETAWSFGVEPRVAMLSYSTGTSGKGADVEAVTAATELARSRRPDIPIEGPIQYDAAVEPTVAAKKLPDSDVAGRATVFIFPDLETGNVTYKAVQRSSGAVAIGPVLQGLRKPVNDLSRGCLVPDIVNTVVITAIQAQEAGGRSTSRLALAPAQG